LCFFEALPVFLLSEESVFVLFFPIVVQEADFAPFLSEFQQSLLVVQLLLLQVADLNEGLDEYFPFFFVLEPVPVANLLFSAVDLLDENL
jgi:hypothetical protein